MAKRNRATLREKFKDGEMPSMREFFDLIDSQLNILDEGFDKTPADGLKVSQLDTGKLMSFYQNIDVQSPIWSIRLDRTSKSLIVGTSDNQDLLTFVNVLDPNQALGQARIGVNKKNPEYLLDVGGTISSQGRIGNKGQLPAPANGEWHTILRGLDGCQAFEITAGAGKEKSGRYAIMHALALNAFNSKSHITYHQAHYDSRCNRLELQWIPAEKGTKNQYDLQIRVGCTYGEGVWIKYFITQLWFDHNMSDCKNKPDEATPS